MEIILKCPDLDMYWVSIVFQFGHKSKRSFLFILACFLLPKRLLD